MTPYRFARFLPIVTAVVLSAGLASASDWASWLGPNQDGSIRNAGVFTADGVPPELAVTWRMDGSSPPCDD